MNQVDLTPHIGNGNSGEVCHGMPCADVFVRVRSRLYPDELTACVGTWLTGLGEWMAGDVIAIDGHTRRRSFDRAADKGGRPRVSVWGPCQSAGVRPAHRR